MWQLVINGPGYFETTYALPEGVTRLGRADENDVVLSGDLVSRRHARLTVQGARVTFEDLDSRNGSWRNGQPVKGLVEAHAGDTLSVGENSLLLRQTTPAEAAETELADAGAQGVRRLADEVDLGRAVLVARDVRDSVVLRALDNLFPFDASPAPLPEPGAPPPPAEPRVAQRSLALLYRVAERLSAAQSLKGFLEETLDLVMRHAGAGTAVVLLRHPSGVLVPAAVRHSARLAKGEVPVSDAIVEAALAQGQALAVSHAQDDARFRERASVVLYGADQVLAVPLGQEPPFAGLLYLNRDQVGDEPLEQLLDTCTAIARLLHSAVQKFEAAPAHADRLRQALERFHAPDIVERRVAELRQAGAPLTALEERQVTVLFADLADFTALAKKLGPEKVVGLLNELYARTTHTIFSFEGTVDKFLGDAVMALFGAPYGRGDDAIRAVRCARTLVTEWEKAMAARPLKERCRLKVGLSTGKVLVGTVGSEARLDFTAVGEPVNVAAWLCASAQPGEVLVTGKTLAAVGARFDVQPLGERPLGGGRVRLAAFEVLDEDSDSGTLSGVKGER